MTSAADFPLTEEEMRVARIDMAFRDRCADKLVPLNKCRRASFFLPWKCEEERHAYEKCEYLEYKLRVAKASAARQEA
ncbi:NUOB18 [Auxenochlorella protothecoides x Auxenochlorella symbiontica]|uniref:NADH dehydrogenase [ubiquinone] 1 beta subcomplex subunit 7 n=2 Tax=Auxenochlorella protothecoides TaxID=3075 RepID=A0A3M7L5Z2_AUXPR|nr:hypothetical protein APUTEX25_004214 [Auxenochlorella protothecoides]|eukprot:RMZ57380.1 hypothetical protein APUTEX25_004214 [Auxenochlorella protothecoides]